MIVKVKTIKNVMLKGTYNSPERKKHMNEVNEAPVVIIAKPSNKPWIIMAVVVLILIVLAITFRSKLFPQKTTETTSGYTTIVLATGANLFAHYTYGDKVSILKDVYSLVPVGTSTQQTLSGPIPQLNMNTGAIIYTSDLDPNSEVGKAIISNGK